MFAKWVGGILVVAAVFGLIGLVTIAPELAKNQENAGFGTDVTGNDSNSTSTDQQSDKGPHTWYKAAFCMDESHCVTNDCEVSQDSPASVYEANQAYPDDQIIDGDNGRVDVVSQGERIIFFKDQATCKKFSAEGASAAKQEQQQQQQELDKYR